MKAVYENDTEKGPGYGILRLTDLQLAPPQDGWRFSVRRSSDRQCLIPGGWQDAESPLEPAWATVVGEALLLYVGHETVDQLDELETYRISLIGPGDARQSCHLSLQEVVYSPMRGGGRLSDAMPETPPPPPKQPPLPPEEPPASPPADAFSGQSSVVAGLLPEFEMPPVAPPRPWWPKAAAALAALVLIAAGWWWFLGGRTAPSSAVPPPAEPASAANESKPAPDKEQATGDPAQPEAPLTPMQQARACLRAKCGGDKALDLSGAMPETPDGRDAAFLLLGAAAEAGQAKAMVPLARFYDPTDEAPAGSIRKDAEQARRWYAKAKAAGAAEAAARLDGLDDWLRRQAEAGDAKARELLDGKP
ncbi:MAG: hypothetical protein ACP59X_02675 [Solidesulfovibrio sp. DCME]|uniref:hypothetical protein n=1 Tax=Solidesulfovibrio sp. DCME TaxID=3447380 RepID=UPI003D0BCD18